MRMCWKLFPFLSSSWPLIWYTLRSNAWFIERNVYIHIARIYKQPGDTNSPDRQTDIPDIHIARTDMQQTWPWPITSTSLCYSSENVLILKRSSAVHDSETEISKITSAFDNWGNYDRLQDLAPNMANTLEGNSYVYDWNPSKTCATRHKMSPW